MEAMVNLSRIFLGISIVSGILTCSLNENSDIFGLVLTLFVVSLIFCFGFFFNMTQESINKVLMIDRFKKIGIDIEND